MNRLLCVCLVLAGLSAFAPYTRAGGSGLNVAVVVNQSSSNSVQLGTYYCEQRQVPPLNVLRINWPGGNVEWTLADYTNTLLNPLLNMLASRQLTNQIDYVLLSMDIPYRINADTNGYNSTTSALFYGFKPDSTPLGDCPLAPGSSNAYSTSECVFRLTPPISAGSNSYLVMMLTSSNLPLAEAIVAQGVLSDQTFPTQTVLLTKSADVDRNVRFTEFDNAIFNTRLRGNYSMQRVNLNDVYGLSNLLGTQMGISGFGILPNTFVPGAMADNLTSFGGQIFENSGQTPLLAFLGAGATASFGTVIEPCNYPQKFPDPQDYFYQARGFSLAECYYQSLVNPYQGLMVGEPLAAPFAQPATGVWNGLPANSMLAATTNLSLQFTASDALHPVQQIDLFVDGLWFQTLTNIPPASGNVLNVTLNGQSMNYTVPPDATIQSVASGLAAVLNTTVNTNATKASAFLHGDRIELQSFDPVKTGAQISLSVSNSAGSGPLITFIHASGSNFLDSIAWGIRGYEISGTPALGDVLQISVTETNDDLVNLSVTNISSGGTLAELVQELVDLINTNASPSLQGSDGLAAEDLQADGSGNQYFNLRALSEGYAAAKIQANITGSADFTISPSGNGALMDNLSDLQPRSHLYITAGLTNLSLAFPLNTTMLADGYHELAAVVYEGSSVHTQARATQDVIVQNTPLSATFTCLVGGTNTALEATLQFAVTANTNTINYIQLFSTGGLLAAVTNESATVFSVPGTNLDLGLHPFYAVVTANNGQQYRTPTTWIRLVGMDSPFLVQITAPPLTLLWPASAGRSYDILAFTNLLNPFQVRATVIPTNTAALWMDTNADSAKLFYRVRVTP